MPVCRSRRLAAAALAVASTSTSSAVAGVVGGTTATATAIRLRSFAASASASASVSAFVHRPCPSSSSVRAPHHRRRWPTDPGYGDTFARRSGGPRWNRRPTRRPRRTYYASSSAGGGIRRTTPTMMPEGPEVRTLVRQLQPAVGMRLIDLRFLSGRYVRHGPPRGFDEFRTTMTRYGGAAASAAMEAEDEDSTQQSKSEVDVVKEWKARGKFIYIVLDDGNRRRRCRGEDDSAEGVDGDDDATDDDDFLRSVWITLGMSGRFVSEDALKATEKSGTSGGGAGPRWYLEFLDAATGRQRRIYYLDPRNFGTLRFSLSKSELNAKLRKLGPDILDDDNDDDVFLERMNNQRNPALNVCKFLMDQSKIAGVGNYILAEGLYRASVDPFAQLSELTDGQRRNLIREIREVARTSYDAQGLSRPGGSYRNAEGQRGKFEFELQCYGRDYCKRGEPVLREMDGPHGRTIWYVEDQLFVPRWSRKEDGSRMDEAERDGAKTLAVNAEDLVSSDIAEAEGEEEASVPVETTGDDAVADLLQGLTDPSWAEALSQYAQTDDFRALADFVASERASGATIYPPERDVFAALNLCPLDRVKAVIVGQDPYHGPNQGHGLAFSVRRGVPPPPSLRNIFREVTEDEGIPPPNHGCLDSWARRGVLLLNAVLTVRRGRANSHANRGWEKFTDEVIRLVNDRRSESSDDNRGDGGVVFLLWGGPAQKKGSKVNETRHRVIRTSHPSPLGATKTKSPFLGSRCFGRANEALIEMGREPIDWTVR